MLNDNELQISNKSYTNKDFATIYPELLELAKKLTNKWDPSTSNESDPGVVLLKLLAFIGDKTNYNIDKNILEAFMPSATQESSMRKLSEMNGYEMGYFNSATTDVTFMYRGLMSEISGSMSITLPAYSTVVTGTDITSTYVLLDRVELTSRGVSITKPAIEGTLKYLRGTDSSLVQITNLDDNNRIFFPERFVAVNGIYISKEDEPNNLWDRVDNLSTEVPGTKCFKFGFDSVKNLPYIEFPKDIASLIGVGLDIKYIITRGSDGNIKANLLNKLYNTTDLTPFTVWTTGADKSKLPVVLSDLIMTNNSASGNGKNPETIDEAYNNFKKVVGTFTTLVTSRDYANFIYRLVDSSNNFEVSNVQVSDRRTDINYANTVVTFSEFGQFSVSNEDTTKITPFDLCVYPLNSTNSNYDSASYYKSFKRKVIDRNYFNNRLDEVKTISHSMKELNETDNYLYKNYYNLNARITTTRKVTPSEASSIVGNIKLALYKNFNAREVDYGYEIPFDTILKVIQTADSRIKNVSLDEPKLTTKVMKANVDASEVNYNAVVSNSSEHQKLLAKNIVAGRISLFDYYNDFEFEFFQTVVTGKPSVINYLESMTTEVVIPEASIESGYKLRENEIVQLIGPNLTTVITYPVYINFHYTGGDVLPGIEYQLKTNEELKINYTDTNDVEKNITYSEGTIIRVNNFTLTNTSTDSRAKILKSFNGTPLSMATLTTKETIEIRDFVTSTLETTWKCYWLLDERKNPSNTLFKTNEKEITLSEGESFLYTDDAMTELVILGSGTKLKLQNEVTEAESKNIWTLDRANLISSENINDKGLAAFSSIDWKTINFTNNKLTIQEMTIYTIGEGSTIKVSDVSTNITNTPISIAITETIQYKESDSSDFIDIPQYSIVGSEWLIKSRLDINTSSTLSQEILSNHTITFDYTNSSGTPQTPVVVTKDDTNNTFFNLNIPLQRSGGVNIDLKVTVFTDQSITEERLASVYLYNKGIMPETLVKNSENELIVYEVKDYTEPLSLPLVKLSDKDTLILFYWNKPESGSTVTSITVSSVGGGTVSKYNQAGSDGVLVSGLNIIQLTGTVSSISITIAGTTLESTNDSIIIGKITPINDLNYSRFGFSDADKTVLTTSLLARIGELSTRGSGAEERDIFNYIATLDNSHLIEIEDLSTPYALFDYNNLANQFTLSQIDVDGSTISIVRSSMV